MCGCMIVGDRAEENTLLGGDCPAARQMTKWIVSDVDLVNG